MFFCGIFFLDHHYFTFSPFFFNLKKKKKKKDGQSMTEVFRATFSCDFCDPSVAPFFFSSFCSFFFDFSQTLYDSWKMFLISEKETDTLSRLVGIGLDSFFLSSSGVANFLGGPSIKSFGQSTFFFLSFLGLLSHIILVQVVVV